MTHFICARMPVRRLTFKNKKKYSINDWNSISGQEGGGRYIGRFMWGKGRLLFSLSCTEEAFLCPHQTSCGQTRWLSLLHHTSANSMLAGFYSRTFLHNGSAHCAAWINDAFFSLPGDYHKVIPARSSSTIHVSFTPLTLSGLVCESRCEGLALGFMSLDSEVTRSWH